jgi:hypothetical protein
MGKGLKVLAVLAVAAAAAALVGWFVFDEPLEYWLDCSRSSGTCTLTQKLLVHSRVVSVPISTLRRAQVRDTPTLRGKTRHTVWIASDFGDRFFARYRDRNEAQADSQKIDAFLRDSTRGRLVVTHTDKRVYWAAWALVPAAAVFAVVLASVLFSKKGKVPAGQGG